MVKARYKKSLDTQSRILDAAEKLFAEQGFEATTTRQITALADVRNASVNYYFATKRDLGVAVIDRRFDQLKQEREARLKVVDLSNGNVKVALQGVVEAFVLPLQVLSEQDPDGWRNYNRIIAQIAASGRWGDDIYVAKISELAAQFINAFAQLFPERPTQTIVQAYNFMLGVTLHTFANAGQNHMVGRTPVQPPHQSSIDLVTFIQAGAIALLAHDL